MNRFQEIEFYNTPDCEVMIKPKGDPVRVLAETGKENRVFISAYLPSGDFLYQSMGSVEPVIFKKRTESTQL